MRTWAPKGCTPIIQYHFNWKHVSAIAGLTRTNFVFRLHDGAIKSAQIIEFLKALRAQLRRKLMIVWDGAAQHKSRVVREYLDCVFHAIANKQDAATREFCLFTRSATLRSTDFVSCASIRLQV